MRPVAYFVLFASFPVTLQYVNNTKCEQMETPKNNAFRKENYHFQPGRHKDKNVIWISFPFDHKLVGQLRAAA